MLGGVVGFLVLVSTAGAQVTTTFSGQVRPRYEFRDPAGFAEGADEATSMRVRVGLAASMDTDLSVFVQLQDVRLWGEETHPLRDDQADHLDLHQGYLRVGIPTLDWLTATLGRMEAALGGERLVGPVGWTQQGQSFDGVRIDADHQQGEVALIAYRIADETAPTVTADREFYGAYATVREIVPGGLDLYWLYDRTEGAIETGQHSVGARYVFSALETVEGRAEGTLQRGTRNGTDVSAFMFGARLGANVLGGRGSATLWYDYLSGDDPSTATTEVFSTLFATNHRFYGLADVFLDIPLHTAGAGLQDIALKLSMQPLERIGVAAEVHSFRTARTGVLTGSHFGDEMDFTLTMRSSSHLTTSAGFSYIFHDDPLTEAGRLTEDLKWFYLMVSATF